MQKVDAIIIGSGQGGVPLAVKWARAGKQVCLFERSRLGGTCTNWGCTPSKAFLGAAHMAGNIPQAAKLGIQAEVHVDFPASIALKIGYRFRYAASAPGIIGYSRIRAPSFALAHFTSDLFRR